MRCQTDRHEWTDPEDARKCCNGYHRELRVGTFDGRPWFAHVWVSNFKDSTFGVVAGKEQIHV